MVEMRVLLFGDQALVDHAHIQKQVLESRENPFLSLLFQRASDALRHEIAQLPPAERVAIPSFTTIAELNERTSGVNAHEGVTNALLCISQLAHYIE
jgi:hypothetical protein